MSMHSQPRFSIFTLEQSKKSLRRRSTSRESQGKKAKKVSGSFPNTVLFLFGSSLHIFFPRRTGWNHEKVVRKMNGGWRYGLAFRTRSRAAWASSVNIDPVAPLASHC